MSLTVPSPAGGDMTTEAFLARAPEVSLLSLRVEAIVDSGTATRTLTLAGEDLAGFAYRPGQDLMVLADASGGRIIRRRYTIRRYDPSARTLDLHIVTESDGPGAAWALALKVGDRVEAIGPRGKITLAPAAAWHLFVGDDVAVPAFAAMIEALPAGTRAIVAAEVAAPVDKIGLAPPGGAEVETIWMYREDSGRRPGAPDALLAAARHTPLPEGDGHAYVFGEARVVTAVADALRERGLPAERISAKAYWGLGRANASHGEPLKTVA
jgi:NADPH-dependent ferric siderophore reductase